MASDDKQKHQQHRPHAQFAVGSDIEVTSDEEGFRGIWFPAKILASSKKHKNKYLVEYKSLVSEENGFVPLTEFADPSFIRPALTTDEGDEGSFEVKDVVEAYHLDGWWIGVVIAVLGERSYRVFFNNPPDEVEFERSSLRFHKDWVDGKWILPEKKEKELSHTNLNFSVVQINGKWVHSLQDAEEYLDPYLNSNGKISLPPGDSNYMNGSAEDLRNYQEEPVVPSERANVDNRTTPVQIEQATDVHSPQDSKLKATTPEGLDGQLRASLEIHAPDMEDNDSMGNSSSSCRKMVAQGEIDDSCTNKKASSKQRRDEKHGRSEIRTARKSTAGKDTLEKENAADHIVNDGIRANLAKESEHEEEDFTDKGSNPKRKGGMPHNSLTSQGKSNMGNTKESPQVTGGNETRKKSTRQKKSVYESCMLALKPVRKKRRMTTEALSSTQESNASPNCIAESEANPKCIAESEPASSGGAVDTNDNDNPLSRRLADSHSPPIVVDSTESGGGAQVPNETIEHNDSMNIAENAMKTLPFTKTSPIWKVVEEMEVFQQIPQNPHFQPLYEAKEDRREGLAIGYMVIFSNLVDKIFKLGFGDPKSVIDDSLDTLPDLERHGFNVHPIRARLNELVSIISGHERAQNEFNDTKTEIEERKRQKAVFEKEIDEIENKINVLRRKRQLAVSRVETKKCEIEELETTLESVKCVFEAGREEFERIVNEPW
ncbi:hypothetical protein V2J09_022176 [Rumex salicifolius]